MKTRNASVGAFQIIENSGISYEAVSRSNNANSFKEATALVMQDAMESFGRRIEMALLYGQSPTGLGTINTSTNVSATKTTISFATGAWSSGLWTPLEGASLDIYNPAGTALNTAGAMVVDSIDVVNKTITISGAAGDVTAIDNGTDVNGGYPRFYSAGTNGADEAIGLDKIMTNTGTLFGIDAATYSLWKSNTYAVGGALTFAKVQAGVAVATSRGLSEDVSLYVNPSVWQELSTEVMSFRMLDSSYSSKKQANGTEALEYYSQNGKISVFAHKYVKEGDAFLLPTDRCVRIGSTEVSFNIPGTDNGQVFIQNAATAGFTFRLYSAQSLLCEKPAAMVKFTGIV